MDYPEKRNKANAIIDMLVEELADPEKMYNCHRFNSPSESGCGNCPAQFKHMVGPNGIHSDCCVIMLNRIANYLKQQRIV